MQEEKKQIRVVLRFASQSKTYSLLIPSTWNVKKLKSFITYAFKEDVKTNMINLFYGARLLSKENMIISSIFQDKDAINQLIVSLKPKEILTNENKRKTSIEKNSSETIKKENVKENSGVSVSGDDFEKLEMYVYHCYKDILNTTPKLNLDIEMISKFPLMHSTIHQRVKVINEKNKLTTNETYDSDNIEVYPLRDYFKIEVFFKLFLFFILFGSHIKGYNIPFFISVLVFYYWYCLYTDIVAFYDKKIAEFKLTPEEIKDLKFLDDLDEEGFKEKNEEESEQDEINMEQFSNYQDEEHKPDNNKSDKLINENENENEKENTINGVKQELEDIQIENLDVNGKDATHTNTNNNTRNILMDKEPEGINHIISKFEKKKNVKPKDKKKENGVFKHYVTYGFETIYTLIMSLLPLWCDEFELHNPIITRIINPVNNQTEIKNNEEVINEAQIINNESPRNDQDSYPIMQGEFNLNDSLNPHEGEIKNIHEKHFTELKSQISEKILIKSSSDTRLVNPSEDQNNKYYLVEENESRTESEFVFSENVNIDTLSYNEPIIESWKKRTEKELIEEATEENLNIK